MSYRPQFAYPLIEGCTEQRCAYCFDRSNTPVLATTLAAGAQTSRIPLNFDVDADFYIRAIVASLPSFRLEGSGAGDPFSDSENASNALNFMLAIEYANTEGAGLAVLEGGELGVFVPGGGNISLFLWNSTAAPIDLSAGSFIAIHGIKAYRKGCV